MASVREHAPIEGTRSQDSVETENQVRAHVRAYFSMLEGELRGRQHRPRGNLARQTADSNGGAEKAFRQITAILVEEGLPFHTGYRPMLSYPPGLRVAVESYLRNHPEMLRLMEADVDEPAGMVPGLDGRDLESIAARAPEPGDIPEIGGDRATDAAISGIDFLAREQRNHSLAWSGELFVIQYEIARLREAGSALYADTIEHVSAEQGAGGGYDIHSYDADGRDRFIKVKTTRYRRETPFFVTANEIAMAATHREHFWLYRVFEYRDTPRLYVTNGSLHDRFRLEAVAYRATPR